MLSPADMLIIGAAALIIFGPDQLPKVARRAGQVMRDVQNTSQSFVREMERAADESEYRYEPPPSVVEPASPAAEHTNNERGNAASVPEDLSRPPPSGGLQPDRPAAGGTN